MSDPLPTPYPVPHYIMELQPDMVVDPDKFFELFLKKIAEDDSVPKQLNVKRLDTRTVSFDMKDLNNYKTIINRLHEIAEVVENELNPKGDNNAGAC
jgi:hypothetical protein